jgi:hypothetical protein
LASDLTGALVAGFDAGGLSASTAVLVFVSLDSDTRNPLSMLLENRMRRRIGSGCSRASIALRLEDTAGKQGRPSANQQLFAAVSEAPARARVLAAGLPYLRGGVSETETRRAISFGAHQYKGYLKPWPRNLPTG